MTPRPRARIPLLSLLVLVLAAPAGAQSTADLRPPRVIAPAAILVEPSTGDVVYSRDANKRRPIASTTKLMTALLTIEHLSLDDVLAAAPYSPAPAESILGLRAGQRMSVRDYLRALLLLSANDAASTLAVRVAGSRERFVRLMNQRAQRLGLKDTHYSNPIGLDNPANYSSASDLAKLALILREGAFFRETTNRAKVQIHIGDQPRTILNRNLLVRGVPFVNGVKTGHTSLAGYVLVGSGTRNKITVVSAVLGDPSESARNQDTLALLRFGTRSYHIVTVLREHQRMASATLKYRDERVDLVAKRRVRRTTKVGEKVATQVLGAPAEVEGPLEQGARVGTIVVRQRGKVVDRVPLVTAAAVSAPTTTERVFDYLGRGGTKLALGALLACSLILVMLRRRIARRPGTNEAEIA